LHEKCPRKNKTVQQSTSYFNYLVINLTVQSAVHWHEHMPMMPSALSVTVNDALLELSPDKFDVADLFKVLWFIT